ncbi:MULTISPECIES: hypothetical protein [unclassified Mesorhizobium]|uniref:hypothetical protein n=1 Tax=unclassified Mesorhizobium TaxID=325217 RepID=UPI0003D05B87|nr:MULTISPECIES: hypothetical protein [unclassified Mesorhizobium]ESZ07280.1 hypothetical protein X736_13475 [Mesorhizobium sp. L2C089B000]ESZ33866.1 hypothetical protein X733_13820 [Mesorhizobium sp. L2C067A000]WJI53026.1 hypothetical protein NLY44_10315 [Mesorhizobium sp. C089B]
MSEEKERPTLLKLIDKYVPTVTRDEYTRMAFQYEKQLYDLLWQHHQLHMQYEGLLKHLDELQTEYAKRTMVKVSYGRVTSDHEINPFQMVHHFRLRWSPDPRQAVIAMPDQPYDRDEFPRLFEATMREFERGFVQSVTQQIRAEYGKLYSLSQR